MPTSKSCGKTALSLIIPVRGWPADRIFACAASFTALGSPHLAEIIIVDFGSDEPIATPDLPNCRVVRVEAGVWSLAEAINVGVLAATTPLVVKTDADILIAPDSRAAFDEIAEDLAAGALDMVISQAIDLHQSLGPAEALAGLAEGRALPGFLRPKWGQGGLVFFTRSAWRAIGGFESRFTGWGNEDNDFAERMRRAGFRLGWADRDRLSIHHVWHPPSFAATGVLSQRQRNQKIAREDRSVFRSMAFRHSNFARLAAPQLLSQVDPLVTLAIASTGRPRRDRMVCEAINSFRGQIDNDFEIIVADNGSDPEAHDALARMLARIKWPRSLRLERLEQGSIPAARNAITALARGRYICVVDDDDLALPNRLADHLKVFERDGLVHGSHGGWIDFDETTGVIERNTGKDRSIATLLRGTGKITAHPAGFYRTDVLRAVPYDEAFALGSDFDLALRLANLGFDIAHTNSFVTLRRYHTSNVTITGQSNQVSNGLAARSRVQETFPWGALRGLGELAAKRDAAVYCRNQMSLDSILERLPGYVGEWVIMAPVSAFAGSRKAGQPLALQADGAAATAAGPADDAELASGVGAIDEDLLGAVVGIVPGSLVTRRAGLNQEIIFRSQPLRGLNEALRRKGETERVLGTPVQLLSATQCRLDREGGFDWRALVVNSGERALRSCRFADLTDALVCIAALAGQRILSRALSVIADFDEDGECYYLVARPVRGLERVRALQFELGQRTGVPFIQIAGNGVASDLVPSSRSH